MGMIVAKNSIRQEKREKNGEKILISAVIVGFVLLLFSWIGTSIDVPLFVSLDRVIKYG